MNWQETYNRKLVSVDEAVKSIRSGDTLWAGVFCSNPVQMLEALAKRRDELEHVRIVTALQCAPHAYIKGEYKGHIEAHSIFLGPAERVFFSEGNISVNSVHVSQSRAALRNVYRVDTLFVEVSEPDDEGYLYYGPMGVAWNGAVAGYAKKIIVQVNRCQGKVRGKGCKIHVNDVDVICRFDHPLAELHQPPVSELDERIASYIIPHIPDGATLQVGLGGIANAVAYGLENRKHLGIYTEMLSDSMAYLAKKGAVDSDRVFAALGLGSKRVWEWCNSCEPELGDISDISDPYLAGQHENFISINSCLMADVTGQIGSESIGYRQFSSTGGQLDYVRAASIAKGGQSYLCLQSTVNKKDGSKSSSITVSLPAGQAVTTPRADVMYVVTEWGRADLYNRPLRERVQAMIAIAHPDFRAQLTQEAREVGLLE